MKAKIGSVFVTLLAVGLGGYVPQAWAQDKINNCTTITQPGSYLLGKNLAATGDCLVIKTDFVTVDLNGFAVLGDGTGAGITDAGVGRKGIAIHNGTITGFSDGIKLFGTLDVDESAEISVERVRAIGNSNAGIQVGPGSRVVDSLAANNGGTGIFASFGGVVTGNTARSNGYGIIIGNAATVTGNTSVANGATGIVGGFFSTVWGNTVRDNGVFGIIANASTVTGNTAMTNGNGIHADGTVTGNTAEGNGNKGLEIACPSNVLGNTALGNGGGNLSLTGGGCNTEHNLAP